MASLNLDKTLDPANKQHVGSLDGCSTRQSVLLRTSPYSGIFILSGARQFSAQMSGDRSVGTRCTATLMPSPNPTQRISLPLALVIRYGPSGLMTKNFRCWPTRRRRPLRGNAVPILLSTFTTETTYHRPELDNRMACVNIASRRIKPSRTVYITGS